MEPSGQMAMVEVERSDYKRVYKDGKLEDMEEDQA
jgi:hypothetical protein